MFKEEDSVQNPENGGSSDEICVVVSKPEHEDELSLKAVVKVTLT